MSPNRRTIPGMLACLALAACGTNQVRYQTVSDAAPDAARHPDATGAFKFKLAASIIYLDNDLAAFKSYKEAGAQPSQFPFKVYSVATEAGVPTVYLMTPVSSLTRKETIQITYQGDSRLPKSIGFDATDETEKLIQAVGTIAGLIVAAAAGPNTPEPRLPATIDVSTHLAEAAPGPIAWTDATASNGWKYDIAIGPVPATATATDAFTKSIADKEVSVMFYSACRSAKLTLKEGAYAGKEFSLLVADPYFVETIRIPESGTINFHPTCGVDVATNKSNVPGPGTLLADIASQAKSIKDSSKSKATTGTKAPATGKPTPAGARLGSRSLRRGPAEIIDPGTKTGQTK